MHIQILQESLVSALSIANRFASSRIQLPILANVHLKAKSNKLFISATNLETSFSTHLGAKIKNDGEITVPSQIFFDIISNLNSGSVDIFSDKEVVKIKTSDFSSSLGGMNANDFPSVPSSIDKNSISLKAEEISEVFSKLLFPISNDETRPILTGMLLEFKKDNLTFVSTDGFRLSKRSIKKEINKNYIGKSVVIPKNILVEISKLSGRSEEILFSYNEKDNQVVFNSDNSFYSSRVLSGSFPDYQKVIPGKSRILVSVGKNDLMQAIKLGSVFARDSGNMVKFNVSSNHIEISSESQMSGSQKTKLDVKTEGEVEKGFVIGFNYRFIEEVLSVIKSNDIQIGFVDESSPGVFKDLEDSEFLHLVMPLKI